MQVLGGIMIMVRVKMMMITVQTHGDVGYEDYANDDNYNEPEDGETKAEKLVSRGWRWSPVQSR